MDQPSTRLADHYHLHLAPVWQSWLDTEAQRLTLAGAFQSPVSVDELLQPAPPVIWGGLMPPDVLPLIGNEYGDWICGRIGPHDQIEELIFWYHGGGDWIPVGRTMQEALLHDALDQFRPMRAQMLRGAAETLVPMSLTSVLERLENAELTRWLCAGLGSRDRSQAQQAPRADEHARRSRAPEVASGTCFTDETKGVAEPQSGLAVIIEHLKVGSYSAAVAQLVSRRWALEAAACDTIELALQEPIRKLESRWNDDQRKLLNLHPHWLFDPEYFADQWTSGPLANDLQSAAEQQDWRQAQRMADVVQRRRSDLAWASDIAGWARQRQGDFSGALGCYLEGMHACSFSDQAVRLRSHWFDAKWGKFSLARIAELQPLVPKPARVEDPCLLRLLEQPSADELRLHAYAHWLDSGNDALRQACPEQAYHAFYRAGWDLGVTQLRDYPRLLESLARAARSAGWEARARVAEAHRRCLRIP